MHVVESRMPGTTHVLAPSAFRFVKVLPGATVLFGGSFAEKCAVVGKRGVLVHPNPPIFTSFLDLSINLTNFL